MGASVQINGVTQRKAVVPFGVSVSLTNALPNASGSQVWKILPPVNEDGTEPDAAVNWVGWTPGADGKFTLTQSTAPFAAVTFKPDIEGDYLIELVSNESPTATQTAVARVVETYSGEYLIAAGEEVEADTKRGWAPDEARKTKRLAKFLHGCVRVANVSGGSLARGKVVQISGTQDAHTISPAVNPGGTAVQAQKLPKVILGDNTAAGATDLKFAILEETIANNGTGWARFSGVFEGKADVNYTGFTAGSKVYFNSTGTQINAAPGSGSVIPVGTLLETGATGSLFVGASAAIPSSGASLALITEDVVNGRVGINDPTPDTTIDVHAPSGSAIATMEADVDNTTNLASFTGKVANTTRVQLLGTGANYTPSGALKAAAAVLLAAGAGGASYATSTAAAIHRFYAGGITDADNFVDIVRRGIRVRGPSVTVSGGAVQTMTLSGLAGDADRVIRIVGQAFNATANDTWLMLRPNGATTNLEGAYMQQGGSGISGATDTNNTLAVLRPNSEVAFEATIRCIGTNFRYMLCRSIGRTTAGVPLQVHLLTWWKTNTPEITTVEVVSNGAGEIANGSWMTGVVGEGLF
jgi:hypothetical protein